MPPQDPGVAAIVFDYGVDTPLPVLEVKDFNQIRSFIRNLSERDKGDARSNAKSAGSG
jgi:hypothetical protein